MAEIGSIQLEVWICPTPGCGNYYAASSAQGKDLADTFNTDLKGKATNPRAECPDCAQRGKKVNRLMRRVNVNIVLDRQEPSHAPAA